MQSFAAPFKNFRYLFAATGIFIAFSVSSCNQSAAVRADGVYQSQKDGGSYEYLRFFSDGSVITVSSTGTAAEITKWFNKDLKDVSKGTYTITGSHIKFSATSSDGTVDYDGEVLGDHLSLKTHSRINGYSGRSEYTFVKN